MAGDLDQEIQVGRLTFKKAITYFQAKQSLPSQAYTDLVHAMHDRAFVIAGVTRQDVLTDVQGLVLKALKEGTPLAQFQADFERAIQGKWDPKQGTAWRARVIYETNVRTAYAAGRYHQLMAMRDTHPHWTYHHGDSRRPRPLHLSWDGITLRWDDPWIQTHYTPNGWGCTCYWTATDAVDLEGMGKTGPDQAPPERFRDVPYGERTIRVPEGVDPDWGYAPGANWSRWIAEPQPDVSGWKILTRGTWESQERPASLPWDEARGSVSKGRNLRAVEEVKRVLGGDQKVFRVGTGPWQVPLVVDAEVLGLHLSKEAVRTVELLPDLLQDPFEVWSAFWEDEATGQVVLRHCLVKGVEVGGKRLLLLAQGNGKGLLDAFICLPQFQGRDLDGHRRGRLVYGR